MTILRQNIKALQTHWPHILPLVKNEPDQSLFRKFDLNLAKEATLPAFFSEFAQDENALIFLVGMGMGSEANQIIQTYPQSRVIIFEPSSDLFSIALQKADQTFILTNPNISLHVGPDINIPKIIQQEDDALRALPFHLVVHQQLQEHLPDIYNPLYNSLQNNLLDFKGKLHTIVKQGPLLLKNTLLNAALLNKTVSIKALNHIAQDLPVICVAAGPSLTNNIRLLQGQEEFFFIIAVDSAAKVLLEHDITPHLIVTVDPIPASLTKLQYVIDNHPEIPLVFTPEAYPATILGFTDAPRFIIPGINDLFRLYFSPLLDAPSSFPSMVSVTHTATQLTKILGASTLIFVGLDLALHGTQDHVDGCPISWEKFAPTEHIKITGWDGNEVETVPVLQNQLTTLQEIITQLDEDIKFIDATEGGALIPGTTPMPLHDALQTCNTPPVNYQTIIKKCFEDAEKPLPKRVINCFKHLKKDLQQSLKIAHIGLRSGKEARVNWKLAKIPKKRTQALKKFRKATIVSGNNFDKLMTLLDLTKAIYPLRAHDHHQFIYARKKFNETAESKTEEERIFDELDQNLDYFTSWISSVKEADKLLQAAEKELHSN